LIQEDEKLLEITPSDVSIGEKGRIFQLLDIEIRKKIIMNAIRF